MSCHVDSNVNSDGYGRIYLIRHAKSEANSKKHYTGWLDVGLSDEGVSQAKRAARHFTGIPVGNVYASTLRRAYNTAELIFGDGTEITKLDELKELDLGEFETKTHDQLMDEYPDIYQAWIKDPTLATPPGGEDVHHYFERVIRGFNRIVSENAGKTCAVVAHGGVIRCIVIHVLNMRINDIWKLKADNLSVSLVMHHDENFALTLFNDTCHLRGAGDE